MIVLVAVYGDYLVGFERKDVLLRFPDCDAHAHGAAAFGDPNMWFVDIGFYWKMMTTLSGHVTHCLYIFFHGQENTCQST